MDSISGASAVMGIPEYYNLFYTNQLFPQFPISVIIDNPGLFFVFFGM